LSNRRDGRESRDRGSQASSKNRSKETGIIPPVKFFEIGEVMVKQLLPALALSMIVVLAACTQASDPAGKAVETYLNALVDKKADALSAISCAGWEENALLELDSLQAVETRLEDLSCMTEIEAGEMVLVNCTGSILATYDGEDQQLDLSVRSYRVLKQGSDYLVCGYE
jgi:hypothetical protein